MFENLINIIKDLIKDLIKPNKKSVKYRYLTERILVTISIKFIVV